MPESVPPLVWIDLEMTGLEPDQCRIIEIATLVTDDRLEILGEGPDIVVHQPDDVLAAMDAWNVEHHGESGLTRMVRASTIDEHEAERQTLEFIRQFTDMRKSPLCGNSVWQDRRFLARYMPKLENFMHYRIVDVSSIKELSRRWYPALRLPDKRQSHRAMDDIRESIAELRFYRENVFR